MKYYIATSFRRIAAHREVHKLLGPGLTHDWTRGPESDDADSVSPTRRNEIAEADLKGVADADVIVVLLPGRFGTHVELGAGIAWGKIIIIHSFTGNEFKPVSCIFHHLSSIHRIVGTFDDLKKRFDEVRTQFKGAA